MIWLIKLIWSCLVCSRPIVKSYWSLPLFKLPAAKPDDPFALLNQNKNQTSLYIAGHGWVIKRSNRGHWKAKIEVKEEVKRIMNWGLCWFEHLSLVEELEQVIFKKNHFVCWINFDQFQRTKVKFLSILDLNQNCASSC